MNEHEDGSSLVELAFENDGYGPMKKLVSDMTLDIDLQSEVIAEKCEPSDSRRARLGLG